MALVISNSVEIPDSELELIAIRSQGSGGQNVNKVATAIHLRFDIPNSSLPDFYKERLLALRDQRISKEGVLVIKSQQFRSQDKNRQDALNRLVSIIQSATKIVKARKATKPTKSAQRKRLEKKARHAQTKQLRKNVNI